MAKPSGRPITRRKFVKLTGGAAAAAGMTSAFLFPQRALAQQRTLKIVQWSHFVPGYDKWFDGVFTKEWGAKHNTNVTVDHIATAEIPARAAAEVAAKKDAHVEAVWSNDQPQKIRQADGRRCCGSGNDFGLPLPSAGPGAAEDVEDRAVESFRSRV